MLKLPIIFVQLVFKSKIEFWAELANLFQLDYNSFFYFFVNKSAFPIFPGLKNLIDSEELLFFVIWHSKFNWEFVT